MDVGEEPQWYVVHTFSGYENKVKANLEKRVQSMGMQDRIFRVVVPTEEVEEVKNGKVHKHERRIFPGYVLVEMIMTDESWYVVRNTPGVTGFVGAQGPGMKPLPLSPEEAERVLARLGVEAPRTEVSFRIGDRVEVREGPLEGMYGVVDHVDDLRKKVRVLVDFFGRETPVELDFHQVERH